jgi:hypothetical protein
VDGVVYGRLPVKDFHGKDKVHTETFTRSFKYAEKVGADVGWTFSWKAS